MKYDDLSALSPVVRKEVLSGELSRRIKATDSVAPEKLDSIVDAIVALSLSEVVQGIQDEKKLMEQVQNAKKALRLSDEVQTHAPSPALAVASGSNLTAEVKSSPSPANSQDSRVLDANALNATASAPDHPSTPVSLPATLSTPPRTESPSGSVAVAAATGERERMAAAVAKLEKSRREELVELLMSLPKRERAMCLFNVEVLRAKIADAKMVLEVDEDEEQGTGNGNSDAGSATVLPTPVTPQAKKTYIIATPQTPELSSRGPSAAASPTPATPSGPSSSITTVTTSLHCSAAVGGTTYSVAALAKMPAVEVIKLANVGAIFGGGNGLVKADPLVVRTTDEFVDGLVSLPVQMQKQQLGDKLWRVVKAFGIKSAVSTSYCFLGMRENHELTLFVRMPFTAAKNYYCTLGSRRPPVLGPSHEQLPCRTQGEGASRPKREFEVITKRRLSSFLSLFLSALSLSPHVLPPLSV